MLTFVSTDCGFWSKKASKQSEDKYRTQIASMREYKLRQHDSPNYSHSLEKISVEHPKKFSELDGSSSGKGAFKRISFIPDIELVNLPCLYLGCDSSTPHRFRDHISLYDLASIYRENGRSAYYEYFPDDAYFPKEAQATRLTRRLAPVKFCRPLLILENQLPSRQETSTLVGR